MFGTVPLFILCYQIEVFKLIWTKKKMEVFKKQIDDYITLP